MAGGNRMLKKRMPGGRKPAGNPAAEGALASLAAPPGGCCRANRPARQDRWVFGDRDSGTYLPKFAWTKIERHVLVQGAASPDDPALKGYWADRRRKHRPPLGSGTLHLLRMGWALRAMR